jgi:hypothetical protein
MPRHLDSTDVGTPLTCLDGVFAVGTEPRSPSNVRNRVILIDISPDGDGTTVTARMDMLQALEAVRLLLDAIRVVREGLVQ